LVPPDVTFYGSDDKIIIPFCVQSNVFLRFVSYLSLCLQIKKKTILRPIFNVIQTLTSIVCVCFHAGKAADITIIIAVVVPCVAVVIIVIVIGVLIYCYKVKNRYRPYIMFHEFWKDFDRLQQHVIVRPLSTVGYTSIATSVIHSRQWSN